MNTLDLIRKLYDEDKSPEELAENLDEEARAELARLVEAKDAIDSLPRRRPSVASREAVISFAGAKKPKKRPRMALIISNGFVQRFAAAAVIVVAVGVGYLVLRSPQIAPITEKAEVAQEMARSSEAPAPAAEPQEGAESAARSSGTAGQRVGETSPAEEAADMLAMERAVEAKPESRFNYAAPEAEADESLLDAAFDGRSAAAKGFADDEVGPTILWDEERALQTFYWKVQALAERSPDDEWDEGVPLEGSFQIIEGAKRDGAWREAKTGQ